MKASLSMAPRAVCSYLFLAALRSGKSKRTLNDIPRASIVQLLTLRETAWEQITDRKVEVFPGFRSIGVEWVGTKRNTIPIFLRRNSCGKGPMIFFQGCVGLHRGYSSGLPDHDIVPMPSLSPTMTHGNLVEWKKKEGDEVMAGDILCVVETDKAVVDNESQEDGFLARILVKAGSKDVPVGTPIAVLVDDASSIPKFASYAAAAPADSSATASTPLPDSPPVSEPPSTTFSGPPPGRLGPSVRRLLQESGLDPRGITGTGPRGIVTKGDVLVAMEGGTGVKPTAVQPAAPAATPVPPPPTQKTPKSVQAAGSSVLPSETGEFEDFANSQIRKVIAKRLLESKWGTPHSYFSAEARIDSLLSLRKELKEVYSASISVNDLVVKAVAMALKEVPQANAFFEESSEEINLSSSVDVCVAVATDRGLMTPIVRNADTKSLSAISSEVKSLAEKARAGKLKPDEFVGGSFSISNLGMFPIDRFNAIINPPQAGILAIGKGNKVVIWEEDSAGVGKPQTVTRMEFTLSADKRVIDEDIAGKFLSAMTANLEDPQRLIL